MPYGQIKVDEITFTNAGVDQTISVSGVVASISGNITATGTISGNVIRGGTLVSGATVTGTAGQFGTITGNAAGFTTVTGTTVTGTTAQFTTVTGGTAGFTTITGTTVTGTTANFVTVSGTTVTGNVGNFTTVTGGTVTLTSGVFGAGTASLPSISFTSDLNTGIYSPFADQIAISTNSVQRIKIDADGNVNISNGGLFYDATNNRLAIGTTNPIATLEVRGGQIVLNTISANSSAVIFKINDVTKGAIGPAGILGGSDNDMGYRVEGANNHVFYIGASELARLDSSGRLGIGTTNPDALLTVNGVGAHGLGTATAPSYAFTGDLNTGIYSPGADQVAISTNGTGRLFVDSSGRVLVGTSTARSNIYKDTFTSTAPVQIETVTNSYSNGLSLINYSSSAYGPVLTLGTSGSNTQGTNTLITSGGEMGWINFTGNDGTNFRTGASIGASVDGSSGSGDMPGRIVLSTTADGASSPTERMRIDSSGRVGIGTTPSYLVHAASTLTGGADTGFRMQDTTNNRVINLMRTGSTYSYIGIGGTEGVVYSDATLTLATDNATPIKFCTGAERARIDSSGRLLVGTSTAFSASNDAQYGKIQVLANSFSSTSQGIISIGRGEAATSITSGEAIGQIHFTDNTGNIFANIECSADATAGSGDYPGRLVFSTTADGASSPTERMRIDRNGTFGNAVGIYNNTTVAAANMFVGAAGDLGRSTSSAQYKINIETLEDFYADAILDCRPVWYQSTCANDNPNWGWWGFIAEEVAEIDPRLVHWKTTEPVVQENGSIEHVACDPKPDSVQYDRFVPHLLNLIKRQKEQIEAMEARLSALEGV